MWKKDFKVQSQVLVKRSEIKKFKGSLQQAFPILQQQQQISTNDSNQEANSVNNEQVEPNPLSILFPPKEDVTQVKISGSHTLIYVVKKQPLFFDLDGRGDFYPTGK
jgi:predicted ribosome-associated RNA-binding protein Tma20